MYTLNADDFPILGARFGFDRVSAAALLAATTLSFVTFAIVLGLVLPG
jgi:hypothetical protein